MPDDSLSWPNTNSTLFSGEDDWEHNACLGWAPDKWNLYAQGYLQAAEVIANHVQETDSNQDTLIYPCVFLYRQYLELILKGIIMEGRCLLDSPGKLRTTTHDITSLWSRAKEIIRKEWPDADRDEMEDGSCCIKEFMQHDPSSEFFRYPTKKDGKPTVPDYKLINFRHFKETMELIASYLDGVATGIEFAIDVKRRQIKVAVKSERPSSLISKRLYVDNG